MKIFVLLKQIFVGTRLERSTVQKGKGDSRCIVVRGYQDNNGLTNLLFLAFSSGRMARSVLTAETARNVFSSSSLGCRDS